MKHTHQIKRVEKILGKEVQEDPEAEEYEISELLAAIMHFCSDRQYNYWELQDKSEQWYKKGQG